MSRLNFPESVDYMVELIIGEWYRSHQTGAVMRYLGRQSNEGKTYYNFYEPELRLFYWLDEKDVEKYIPTQAESNTTGNIALGPSAGYAVETSKRLTPKGE